MHDCIRMWKTDKICPLVYKLYWVKEKTFYGHYCVCCFSCCCTWSWVLASRYCCELRTRFIDTPAVAYSKLFSLHCPGNSAHVFVVILAMPLLLLLFIFMLLFCFYCTVITHAQPSVYRPATLTDISRHESQCCTLNHTHSSKLTYCYILVNMCTRIQAEPHVYWHQHLPKPPKSSHRFDRMCRSAGHCMCLCVVTMYIMCIHMYRLYDVYDVMRV